MATEAVRQNRWSAEDLASYYSASAKIAKIEDTINQAACRIILSLQFGEKFPKIQKALIGRINLLNQDASDVKRAEDLTTIDMCVDRLDLYDPFHSPIIKVVYVCAKVLLPPAQSSMRGDNIVLAGFTMRDNIIKQKGHEAAAVGVSSEEFLQEATDAIEKEFTQRLAFSTEKEEELYRASVELLNSPFFEDGIPHSIKLKALHTAALHSEFGPYFKNKTLQLSELIKDFDPSKKPSADGCPVQ